jgi:hypothetical protein
VAASDTDHSKAAAFSTCTMFIGNRRTKHSIHAFRSPANVVVIPKDAVLNDVRTTVELGYRFPAALRIMARTNPSLHIFEYRGETLYIPFAHGLVEATTDVDPE